MDMATNIFTVENVKGENVSYVNKGLQNIYLNLNLSQLHLIYNLSEWFNYKEKISNFKISFCHIQEVLSLHLVEIFAKCLHQAIAHNFF